MAFNVRLLNENEYRDSKKLWTGCFPQDGMEFIDWYYSFRSCPEYVLGAFEGDSLVSMLHMIPMDIRFNRFTHRVCFVSGVCTDIAYRGKGLCTSLFRAAFPIMRQRGFHATMLQPFDTEFYSRYGYRTIIRRLRARLSGDIIRKYAKGDLEVTPTPKLLAGLYNAFMGSYSGATIRSEYYFSGLMDEYSMEAGKLICSSSGYCAGYMDGGCFNATELVMPMEKGRRIDMELLVQLLPKDCDSAEFPLPCDALPPFECETELENFSMLALIDAELCRTRHNMELYYENGDMLCDANGTVLYGFDRY